MATGSASSRFSEFALGPLQPFLALLTLGDVSREALDAQELPCGTKLASCRFLKPNVPPVRATKAENQGIRRDSGQSSRMRALKDSRSSAWVRRRKSLCSAPARLPSSRPRIRAALSLRRERWVTASHSKAITCPAASAAAKRSALSLSRYSACLRSVTSMLEPITRCALPSLSYDITLRDSIHRTVPSGRTIRYSQSCSRFRPEIACWRCTSSVGRSSAWTPFRHSARLVSSVSSGSP